jgi:hypothetical protein
MSKDLGREGIHQPTEDMLITGKPSGVGRVGENYVLLVGFFNLKGLDRCGLKAIQRRPSTMAP